MITIQLIEDLICIAIKNIFHYMIGLAFLFKISTQKISDIHTVDVKAKFQTQSFLWQCLKLPRFFYLFSSSKLRDIFFKFSGD